MRSKVKWFDKTKGYGFIEATDSDRDYYVHVTRVGEAVTSQLEPGLEVEFDVIQTKKGLHAYNIVVVDDYKNQEISNTEESAVSIDDDDEIDE